MYDFYANPPKTRDQIREYLTSWLEKVESPPFEHKGEMFQQELGFRRAFHSHAVFRSVSTGEYVWWVCPDEEVESMRTFPTKRFPSYEAMLEAVVEEYYKLWN
jgi:hypothetical protein